MLHRVVPDYRLVDTRRFSTFDYFHVYEEIEMPVLQMHGENDASIPIEAVRDLSSRIADTRFVMIEGSDHFIHIDAPERRLQG